MQLNSIKLNPRQTGPPFSWAHMQLKFIQLNPRAIRPLSNSTRL